MATVIYLDTHVLAWLYAEGTTSLPAPALSLLESVDDIRVSPMVRLELQYLYEIERVSQPALTVLDTLGTVMGLNVCDAPFPAVIREAETQSWTRDPFDRIIVAQASLFGAPLLTKDESIHKHYSEALWG